MSRFKIFVRGSETLDTTSSTTKSLSHQRPPKEGQLSPDEARSFYERLVGLSNPENPAAQQNKHEENSDNSKEKETETIVSPKRTQNKVMRSCRSSHPQTERQLRRLHNDFLRHAQEGELEEMKRCRTQGVDLNYSDQYRWTALMCSSRSGHGDIVQWLLEEGADTHICNNQGKTAASLAKNRAVSRLFSKHQRGQSLDPECNTSDQLPSKFFCDVCRQEFTDTTLERHLTSTIHLFSRQDKPQSTHYYIPPANKGFQMMVKSGWEPEKGLGLEGQGRKFPVKTILKRDRQGFGVEESKPAKVTHFSSNDLSAVAAPVVERKMKASTLSKKQRRKQLSKERAKERDFRLSFHTE